MEEQAKRSPGGKLALWALYALRILCLGHCALLVGSGKNSQRSRRQRGGDFGTTAGKWLGALLGMLVLGGIGSILGAVVWYTRPSRGEQDHQR